jgi:hypothetical protein
MAKRLITLAHGGKLKYRGIITLKYAGTAVNYRGIFETFAPGLYPLNPVFKPF